MRENVIPVVIPVYNTSPKTLYTVVSYLHCFSKNPVVIVNDGSRRRDTIEALNYIREKGYAIVLDKDNGGKIDALMYGIEWVIKSFRPRCVLILDDDIIPHPMADRSLDDLLSEKCSLLSSSTPVTVFPVANQAYILSRVLEKLRAETCLEHGINPGFHFICTTQQFNSNHKPNILDYVQDIEHVVSTNHSRLIARSGLWVNGSGSLWLVDELKEVLKSHSKEHAADELEISILLRARGKEIGFSNEITLYAELISKPLKFLKQRVYWSYGAFRVFAHYPGIILPKKASHPLYTMYILNPYVFLLLLVLPVRIGIFLALVYGFLIIAQLFSACKGQLRTVGKLVGGQLIATIALLASTLMSILAVEPLVTGYIVLAGALTSIAYTLALLISANRFKNNYLKLRVVDFAVLVLYLFFYSIFIMPMGALIYLYKVLAGSNIKTYKITQ